ncbi:sensor histidine kinase [Embleya sp. AB8]|uniref:sensor histidine kinase n=1 Tax=Embleya sp. AB8 TaxID=3156304 RepID=UPI003C763D78
MVDELRPPLTQRLRPRHWRAIDVLLGIVLAGSLVTLRPHPDDRLGTSTWIVVALLVLILAGAVAFRRTYPILAVTAALVAESCLRGLEVKAAIGFATAFTLYTAALTVRNRPAVWALGTVAVAVGFATAPIPLYPAILAWTLGTTARSRRQYAEALRRQAERQGRVEAEQRAREQAAEERLRIARELHDVVAHSMSLITVQAGVAHYVGTERPEEALRALGSIEATGRTALRDMRRLLGMLRDSDGTPQDAELAPAPTLATVDTLVRDAAAAGLTVELSVLGERRELPTGVELAAYRIVQEALTNVIRHAGVDHCQVELHYTEREITLDITDSGRGDGGSVVPGHGLVGMRERVVAYGGEFAAGSRAPEPGFRVRARVPIEEGAR